MHGIEIVPEDFDTLLLDGLPIVEFSIDDKKFLEKFVELKKLTLNQTSLRSLKNFPALV